MRGLDRFLILCIAGEPCRGVGRSRALQYRIVGVRVLQILQAMAQFVRIVVIVRNVIQSEFCRRRVDPGVPGRRLAIGVRADPLVDHGTIAAREIVELELLFRGLEVAAEFFQLVVKLPRDIWPGVERRATAQAHIPGIGHWLTVRPRNGLVRIAMQKLGGVVLEIV